MVGVSRLVCDSRPGSIKVQGDVESEATVPASLQTSLAALLLGKLAGDDTLSVVIDTKP